jgi:NADPH:quinone reductase
MTDTTARGLRLTEKAKDAEALAPQIVAQTKPVPGPDEAVVEVRAAAINPSDVKAALGAMPHAVWPRTPGRDFAGRVIDGPKDWIGVDVWGTGGDLGVTRDGTHARYLVLPTTALAKKPASVSVAAAATVGVPFITAHEGLRRAHLSGSGQNVVVFGAHGKVGQAAIQLATLAGAKVVGVERGATRYEGHASSPVTLIEQSTPDLAARVMEATGGRGADIAYNTVGSPYFQAVLDSLAIGGTQVLISTIDRNVPFDILAFYRRNLQMLGVDSLKLTVTACAAILNALAPRFDDGGLKAFDVDDATLVPIDEAADAYRRVLAGSRDRVVFGF